MVLEGKVRHMTLPSSPLLNFNSLEYHNHLPDVMVLFKNENERQTTAAKIWCSHENLYHKDLEEEGGLEFPQINYGQCNSMKYRFFYGCGFRHLVGDSLIKVDVVTKKLKVWRKDGFYPSEPVFVPVPGASEEDGGVILSVVVTPNQNESTFLLVLDAKTFEELGRAEVPVPMPYGFHGTFVPRQ